MAKFLIHLTTGPEDPTKASLGFLVAKTAIEEGHQVTLFLAGDAVYLIREAVVDNLTGLGTGKLREHFDIISRSGAKIYLSGMSAKSRGLNETDFSGKSIEAVMPSVLIRLTLEHDRTLTY